MQERQSQVGAGKKPAGRMVLLEMPSFLKIDVYFKMEIKNRLILAALRIDLPRAGVPTNFRSP